jgi:methionine aminopeptidase
MWSATNFLRLALTEHKTLVVAVDVGYMDTDMAVSVTASKTAPQAVTEATVDAVEAGQHEVLADDLSRQVRAALGAPISALYRR